jgi:hypothetical protein
MTLFCTEVQSSLFKLYTIQKLDELGIDMVVYSILTSCMNLPNSLYPFLLLPAEGAELWKFYRS